MSRWPSAASPDWNQAYDAWTVKETVTLCSEIISIRGAADVRQSTVLLRHLTGSWAAQAAPRPGQGSDHLGNLGVRSSELEDLHSDL